ncbi:hypothetical protein ACFSHT_29520 [Paraburkholderia silviterrae]|nr:hypothetical protein [Paraburkholderia silviterrae]
MADILAAPATFDVSPSQYRFVNGSGESHTPVTATAVIAALWQPQ